MPSKPKDRPMPDLLDDLELALRAAYDETADIDGPSFKVLAQRAYDVMVGDGLPAFLDGLVKIGALDACYAILYGNNGSISGPAYRIPTPKPATCVTCGQKVTHG